MSLKIATWLMLATSINCMILKEHRIPLSSGVILEISVKSKNGRFMNVSKMTMDIDRDNKEVILSMAEDKTETMPAARKMVSAQKSSKKHPRCLIGFMKVKGDCYPQYLTI